MTTFDIRIFAAVGVSVAFSACGGGESARVETASPAQAATAAGETSTGGSSAAATFAWNVESPRAVTHLSFVGRELAVGFSDGSVAMADVNGAKLRESKVAKVHAVVAVSPSGNLALLGSSPPAIVNFDGELILQMNTVKEFESATFARDGLTLYVADKVGKVRIWGQAHSFEEDQHKEKMEDYLNRQAPDFHVEFPSVAGPIHTTDDGRLVVADGDGIVRIWNPKKPSRSKRVMQLAGAARSLDSSQGQVFTTSRSGKLKVGVLDPPSYLPWSRDADGAYASADPMTPARFYSLDAGRVAARNTEDGSVVWETPLPAGHPCGLATSTDGKWVAACVGNVVAVVSSTDGAPHSWVSRGERAQWTSVDGKPIAP